MVLLKLNRGMWFPCGFTMSSPLALFLCCLAATASPWHLAAAAGSPPQHVGAPPKPGPDPSAPKPGEIYYHVIGADVTPYGDVNGDYYPDHSDASGLTFSHAHATAGGAGSGMTLSRPGGNWSFVALNSTVLYVQPMNATDGPRPTPQLAGWYKVVHDSSTGEHGLRPFKKLKVYGFATPPTHHNDEMPEELPYVLYSLGGLVALGCISGRFCGRRTAKGRRGGKDQATYNSFHGSLSSLICFVYWFACVARHSNVSSCMYLCPCVFLSS